MASGGLPALAQLRLSFNARLGGLEDVRTRVTHLYLIEQSRAQLDVKGDEDVGYELGVAVGKLRRLKVLELGLSTSGRGYDAFVRGLAASGGDRPPVPLLWRVRLLCEVHVDDHLVASLLLPSVRVFFSSHLHTKGARLAACAVRQAAYKHTWVVACPTPFCLGEVHGPEPVVQAIVKCIADFKSEYALHVYNLHLKSWRRANLA
jgi:hypothetical protein